MLCLYGGSPYQPQENKLRRGVDVVVGTPGRVKDHLERGTLRFKALRFRVLDECDEMLNMGASWVWWWFGGGWGLERAFGALALGGFECALIYLYTYINAL